MNKKWIFLTFFSLSNLNFGLLSSEPYEHEEIYNDIVGENDDSEKTEPTKNPTDISQNQNGQIRPTLEFKAGYFFFGESKMRKAYDRGGIDLQLCASYPLWKWFQIYAAIEYLEREGRSLHGKQRTRIWELPISLGIKTVARITEKVQYYATIGPRYFLVYTHNSTPYMDKHLNQNGCGGFVGTGFNFFPLPHLLIDVFGEYSYCRLHFHPHKTNTFGESAQVGGFAFGAGIGYAF